MSNNYSGAPTVDVKVISPSYYPNEQTNYSYQTDPKVKNKSLLKNSKFKCTCIIISIIAIILLIVATVLLLLYGLVPCVMSKCHSKASTCINRPFYAQCVCDYGYAGNGKEYCDQCGITYNPVNVRIVGGKNAVPNSWPYAALVYQEYTNEYQIEGKIISVTASFLCGGTLLNHKTVLSASHCVKKSFEYEYDGKKVTLEIAPNRKYPTWESMFTVYLGLHDKGPRDNPGLKIVAVEKLIMHENYDTNTLHNDVAILKLKELIVPNKIMQFACLPQKSSPPYPNSNTEAWVVGWGTTSFGGLTSDILKNLKITVYDESFCSNVIPVVPKNWNLQICAGNIRGGEDTCQGDSGGGLYVKEIINGTVRFVNAGIVSYGEGCGLVGKPGIYARTSYYMDWIRKHSDFKSV